MKERYGGAGGAEAGSHFGQITVCASKAEQLFFSQSLDLPAYRPTKSVQVRFESRLLLISLTVTRNSFFRWTLKRGPCIDFGENWSQEFSLYFGY